MQTFLIHDTQIDFDEATTLPINIIEVYNIYLFYVYNFLILLLNYW
jgi:hypothetical protein